MSNRMLNEDGGVTTPSQLRYAPTRELYHHSSAFLFGLEPAMPARRTRKYALAATRSVACLLAGCGGGGGGAGPNPPADDTAAVQALLDQGGVVTLEARAYHLSRTLTISRSGTTLQGAGSSTVLDFEPQGAPAQCANDRVVTTPCALYDELPRQVGAPIAVGDVSFQAARAADTADLSAGDWLVVNDLDAVVGDRVAVDWVQVASVAGTVVTVAAPFRMAFTTARPWLPRKSGLGFERVPLVANVAIRNLTAKVEQVPNLKAAGISLFGALNVSVDNVTVENYNGQPLYSYLSKQVTVSNSRANGGAVLSEFGASVDVTLSGNEFNSSAGAGFGLDVGLGFFSVTDNIVSGSANAGFYALYGVHDGTLSGNQIGYVNTTSADRNATGMLLRGAHNITIDGNSLSGGAGLDSVGIDIEPYTGALVEPDTGVTLGGNTIDGFATAVQGP